MSIHTVGTDIDYRGTLVEIRELWELVLSCTVWVNVISLSDDKHFYQLRHLTNPFLNIAVCLNHTVWFVSHRNRPELSRNISEVTAATSLIGNILLMSSCGRCLLFANSLTKPSVSLISTAVIKKIWYITRRKCRKVAEAQAKNILFQWGVSTVLLPNASHRLAWSVLLWLEAVYPSLCW